MPFTADEAWSFAQNDSDFGDQAIALADWPVVDPNWEDAETADDITALRSFLSSQVNDRLEALRQQKTIGQSLDAKLVITSSTSNPDFARLQKYASDLPELFILSQVALVESTESAELEIEVAHADGVRCPRSWRWVPELVDTNVWGPVSARCAEALNHLT